MSCFSYLYVRNQMVKTKPLKKLMFLVLKLSKKRSIQFIPNYVYEAVIMEINSKNFSAINAYQKLENIQQNRLHNTDNGNAENENRQVDGIQNASHRIEQAMSKQELRIEQQASLVAHLFGDDSTKNENSLKMAYQTAIEKLNEILQFNGSPTSDVSGVDQSNTVTPISEEALKSQGGMEYWTPENTAKRIVEQATAFYGGFEKAHPELEGEALMAHFIDVIGSGIETGINEARNILDDLNVLEGNIAENITQTQNLVFAGLKNYEQNFLSQLDTEQER